MRNGKNKNFTLRGMRDNASLLRAPPPPLHVDTIGVPPNVPLYVANEYKYCKTVEGDDDNELAARNTPSKPEPDLFPMKVLDIEDDMMSIKNEIEPETARTTSAAIANSTVATATASAIDNSSVLTKTIANAQNDVEDDDEVPLVLKKVFSNTTSTTDFFSRASVAKDRFSLESKNKMLEITTDNSNPAHLPKFESSKNDDFSNFGDNEIDDDDDDTPLSAVVSERNSVRNSINSLARPSSVFRSRFSQAQSSDADIVSTLENKRFSRTLQHPAVSRRVSQAGGRPISAYAVLQIPRDENAIYKENSSQDSVISEATASSEKESILKKDDMQDHEDEETPLSARVSKNISHLKTQPSEASPSTLPTTFSSRKRAISLSSRPTQSVTTPHSANPNFAPRPTLQMPTHKIHPAVTNTSVVTPQGLRASIQERQKHNFAAISATTHQLQSQILESLDPASRSLAAVVSSLVIVQLEPWLTETSKTLMRLEKSSNNFPSSAISSASLSPSSFSASATASSFGSASLHSTNSVLSLISTRATHDSADSSASLSSAEYASNDTAIGEQSTASLLLKESILATISTAATIKPQDTGRMSASVRARGSISGISPKASACDSNRCEACGATKIVQAGSLLSSAPSAPENPIHVPGHTFLNHQSRPSASEDIINSLAYREMQKRKEKERRELRDKAGQAQSGGGALLKDINIVGFDDIDTSQQRMTCVKCEGLGFYHGRETKHDGPLKKQCKGCSSCATCDGVGILFGWTACKKCKTKGNIPSLEDPQKLSPCQDCHGIGLISPSGFGMEKFTTETPSYPEILKSAIRPKIESETDSVPVAINTSTESVPQSCTDTASTSGTLSVLEGALLELQFNTDDHSQSSLNKPDQIMKTSNVTLPSALNEENIF